MPIPDAPPGFNHNGLPTLPVVVPSQPRKANRHSFPPMAPIPEQHLEPSVARRASFSGEVSAMFSVAGRRM